MYWNKMIPELSVTNLDKSLTFYKTAGFVVEYDRPENNFPIWIWFTKRRLSSTSVSEAILSKSVLSRIETPEFKCLTDASTSKGEDEASRKSLCIVTIAPDEL